jgi:hypothetical protein
MSHTKLSEPHVVIDVAGISGHNDTSQYWWRNLFIKKCFDSKKTVEHVHFDRTITTEDMDVVIAKISNILTDYEIRIKQPIYGEDGKIVGIFYCYESDQGVFDIQHGFKKEPRIYLEGVTTDPTICTRLVNAIVPHVKKPPKDAAQISVIVAGPNGLGLVTLGHVHEDIIHENYNPGIIEQYQYVISEYKKQKPAGRMTIINGEPGTGKTYMIRSLVSELMPAKIILVPQSMVSQIDGPSLIPLLMDAKKDYPVDLVPYSDEDIDVRLDQEETMPIYLIMEDADACLVPRAGDNISVVSSLLNYTDGLFGELLDLRVIATTNAAKMDFDQAYLRPGRLCQHISVNPVNKDQAKKIYNRLTGQNLRTHKEEYTLAELYAEAKGWIQKAKEHKKVGF